jgi:hypothetical protein
MMATAFATVRSHLGTSGKWLPALICDSVLGLTEAAILRRAAGARFDPVLKFKMLVLGAVHGLR